VSGQKVNLTFSRQKAVVLPKGVLAVN